MSFSSSFISIHFTQSGTSKSDSSDPDEVRRQFFRDLKHILFICPISLNDTTTTAASTTNNKNNNNSSNNNSSKSEGKKRKKSEEVDGTSSHCADITGNAGAVLFDRFEDEVFMQHALICLRFRSVNASGVSKNRVALLLTIEGWQKALADLLLLVPDNNSSSSKC